MSRRNTFLIAVAVPFLILLAMIVKPAATVVYGKEILLETRAVDPNDLFRGDYVSLAFKVSDLPKAMLPEPFRQYSTEKLHNLDLYVSLKQEGRFYVIDQISEQKPTAGIYLKGKFQYEDTNSIPETIHLDYTLDKYFVMQGSGVQLQQASYKGNLVGTVKVLDGYGIITGVQANQ